MSFYYPPWNNALEPNQGNVRQWLDNLYSKFQPIEQARWNQSRVNIGLDKSSLIDLKTLT